MGKNAFQTGNQAVTSSNFAAKFDFTVVESVPGQIIPHRQFIFTDTVVFNRTMGVQFNFNTVDFDKSCRNNRIFKVRLGFLQCRKETFLHHMTGKLFDLVFRCAIQFDAVDLDFRKLC